MFPSAVRFRDALVAKCTSRNPFEDNAQNCVHAASRNTNPGHNITILNDLQSFCEVMSTVQLMRLNLAGASETSGRKIVNGTWGRQATGNQLCPTPGNFRVEPDDPSLVAPRLPGTDCWEGPPYVQKFQCRTSVIISLTCCLLVGAPRLLWSRKMAMRRSSKQCMVVWWNPTSLRDREQNLCNPKHMKSALLGKDSLL